MRHTLLAAPLLGAALLMTSAATPALADPVALTDSALGSDSAEGRLYLYPIALTCHESEDSLGADEAYLKFNGTTRWGITNINDGESKSLEDVPAIRFKKDRTTGRQWVDIQLWDNDTGVFGDDDDWLGTVTVSTDDGVPPFDWNLQAEFHEDGANYTIVYQVSDEAP